MNYTNIIKTHLAENGIDFEAFQAQFEVQTGYLRWENVTKNMILPMMPGTGINGVIAEWNIPAKRIAYNGVIDFPEYQPAVYGIETKTQRLYFLDHGDGITTIGLEDK